MSSSADGSPARQALLAFVEANAALLQQSISLYVLRLGLAKGPQVPGVASDVLQDVVLEALAHAERFDPSRQPLAWLLGIAVNVIKRHKVSSAIRLQHERSMSRASGLREHSPFIEDDDTTAFFATQVPSPDDMEGAVEAADQARQLLSLVPAEDQYILRLAVLEDLARPSLAARLGTTPGAARMRLHRALDRLRAAWASLEAAERSGNLKEATADD